MGLLRYLGCGHGSTDAEDAPPGSFPRRDGVIEEEKNSIETTDEDGAARRRRSEARDAGDDFDVNIPDEDRPLVPIDAKRFAVLATCMSAMVILVNRREHEFARESIGVFVGVMIVVGFLETLVDPGEGRRVLASCGLKSPSRLRITLVALLMWAVLVAAVRALAITAFLVITDYDAEEWF